MAWKSVFALGMACAAAVACRAPEADAETGSDEIVEDQGDKIFNVTAVQDLAITIDPADIAKMNAEIAVLGQNWDLSHLSAKRTKAKATFTYAGQAYPATVKIKGMASAQSFDKKPSLVLEFDDKVLGLSNLTLNSMSQDPSKVHEATAYRMYEAVGVPVPRVGYSNLSVNGQPYGLYLTLESIDKHFLERKYGTSGGIVYESTYGGDLKREYVGTAQLVHSSDKTNPDEEASHARLLEFIAAVEKPGDGLFYGDGAIVDTEKVLSMIAMDYVIGDWDNYITANNFRFHRHPQTGKWSIIPTGTDQTFSRELHPYRAFIERQSAFAVLFEKCLASAHCIADYDAALEKAMVAFRTADAAPLVSLIDPTLNADPRKTHDANQTAAERATMTAFIQHRPDEIASARACVANGKEKFFGACAGVMLSSADKTTCTEIDYADGTQAKSAPCNGKTNQRWLVTPIADGAFHVVSALSGKCLSASGAAATCADVAEQKLTVANGQITIGGATSALRPSLYE